MLKHSFISKWTLATVLCSAAATPILGQPPDRAYSDRLEMPSGEVGKRIQELIEVINANDPKRVKTFIADSVTSEFRDFAPMERHIEAYASVYSRTHGMDFYGIRTFEDGGKPDETVVIARNRLTGGWMALILTLEPKPPFRIADLNIAPARPPVDATASKNLTDEEVIPALKAFVSKLVDAEVFSGAVLIAKDGQVLFSEAWGLASREYNVPNKIDTKFNLGSMNKMFTAVAVAQLVQHGKLSFDDPVGKYLSEDWLPREIADKVTIHHLLSHTSGLGSYFNEKFMKSSRELFRTIDDYKPIISGENAKPVFEPGSQWSYSNTGFLLAGAVIEKVTGQSYFEYVRQNIYGPAGMINSDCFDMDQMPPNMAIGYSKSGGQAGTRWVNNLYKHVIRGGPAGGGFSTAEDLLKFDRAMRAGKLLNKETCEKLWTPKPNSPGYGYGFSISGKPGNRIVGHSGGFPGISSVLDLYLDTGYTVVVLSNCDQGAALVNEKLREWLSNR